MGGLGPANIMLKFSLANAWIEGIATLIGDYYKLESSTQS